MCVCVLCVCGGCVFLCFVCTVCHQRLSQKRVPSPPMAVTELRKKLRYDTEIILKPSYFFVCRLKNELNTPPESYCGGHVFIQCVQGYRLSAGIFRGNFPVRLLVCEQTVKPLGKNTWADCIFTGRAVWQRRQSSLWRPALPALQKEGGKKDSALLQWNSRLLSSFFLAHSAIANTPV